MNRTRLASNLNTLKVESTLYPFITLILKRYRAIFGFNVLDFGVEKCTEKHMSDDNLKIEILCHHVA
jgi:hypothetical protein